MYILIISKYSLICLWILLLIHVLFESVGFNFQVLGIFHTVLKTYFHFNSIVVRRHTQSFETYLD